MRRGLQLAVTVPQNGLWLLGPKSPCGDSTFSQLAKPRSAPGPVTETRQKSFQKRELLLLDCNYQAEPLYLKTSSKIIPQNLAICLERKRWSKIKSSWASSSLFPRQCKSIPCHYLCLLNSFDRMTRELETFSCFISAHLWCFCVCDVFICIGRGEGGSHQSLTVQWLWTLHSLDLLHLLVLILHAGFRFNIVLCF